MVDALRERASLPPESAESSAAESNARGLAEGSDLAGIIGSMDRHTFRGDDERLHGEAHVPQRPARARPTPKYEPRKAEGGAGDDQRLHLISSHDGLLLLGQFLVLPHSSEWGHLGQRTCS